MIGLFGPRWYGTILAGAIKISRGVVVLSVVFSSAIFVCDLFSVSF
jgi:hypothetical protein